MFVVNIRGDVELTDFKGAVMPEKSMQGTSMSGPHPHLYF